MGFGSLDSAGLDVVAYAQVDVSGASLLCNSGITTSRSAAGTYDLRLPPALVQDPSRIFFETCIRNGLPALVSVSSTVDPAVFQVLIFDTSGAPADRNFDVIITRTLVAPPIGSPA